MILAERIVLQRIIEHGSHYNVIKAILKFDPNPPSMESSDSRTSWSTHIMAVVDKKLACYSHVTLLLTNLLATSASRCLLLNKLHY